MMGTMFCKLHAVLENFGKVLSALILTAMAFDRFAGVCHPQKKYLRSTRFAVFVLLGEFWLKYNAVLCIQLKWPHIDICDQNFESSHFADIFVSSKTISTNVKLI
jgi:hypothetical protein